MSCSYELEYGTDSLEIHEDAIIDGHNVLVVDDVLATGGTAKAVCEMVKMAGGNIVGTAFLLELEELNGRFKLNGYDVYSLMKMWDDSWTLF